ncbi:MAG: hypothetical protein ABEI99_01460 [Halobaculum sp.]
MVEFTVSGESIEEVDELSSHLRRGEKFAESSLGEAFEKLIDVKDTTERMTKESSVPRTQIEEQMGYDSVYRELQLLQEHGFVTSGGQGGNWEYVGE